MAKTHHVVCKTGRKWTDNNGKERDNTVIIGSLIETAGGAKMIILDAIPFAMLNSTEPVTLYLNEVKGKDGDGERPPKRNTSSAGPKDDLNEDDIPF